MKDKRPGESLWEPWEGWGGRSAYLTVGHVDLESEVVRRALASAMQRDGVVDSLFEGFQLVSVSEVVTGWVGIVDEEREYTLCDASGETDFGDVVASPIEATIVYLI
jgi:hypothetical protein